MSRRRPPTDTRHARPGLRVIVAAVGIIAAMSIAGVLLAWRGYDGRRNDARELLVARADTAAALTERFIADRLALLGVFADLPAVRSGDVEAMRPYLEPVAEAGVDLDGGAGFIDVDGRLLTEPDSGADGPPDLSDRSYVRNVLATGEPYVSEAVTGRLSGAPLVVLATPVRGPTDELIGMLVATVPIALVRDITPAGRDDTVRIVDRAGNLIYDDGVVEGLLPPDDPVALSLPPGQPGASPGLRGEPDRIVAVADAPAAGWRVVLEQPESVIDGQARSVLEWELVALAGAALVGVVAATLVALRTSRLHRSGLAQADELVLLERFTAALVAAQTPEEVTGAVRHLGPGVLGAERVEITTVDRADPGRTGATAATASIDVHVVPAPTEPRHHSLVALMGEQAAQALDRVRSTQEINHIAALGAALAPATTTEEVVAALDTHASVVVGVTSVTTAVVEPSRVLMQLYADPGHPLYPAGAGLEAGIPSDGSAPHHAVVGLDALTPHTEAIDRGDLVTVADPGELRARFPAMADALIGSGVAALVAAPLMIGRSPALGSIVLTFANPRRLDPRDLALISTVSRLGADALGRARLFDVEQHVAETLQASLQPPSLPSVGGWRFTGVHLAGEAGVSVGGDWYDVAVLPRGWILLSVGDVTGRGPVAAGVMGLVRAAIHALALSDPDPASILDHTDRLLSSSTADQLATAWVGLLDPLTGRIHHASAGHLPPLALGPAGKRYLAEEPGLLLGSGLSGTRRTTVYDLEPDASIVAYTDGLCERRDESLDTALRKMSDALGDGTGIDARTVVRRMLARPAADDVVVLVATRLHHRSTTG